MAHEQSNLKAALWMAGSIASFLAMSVAGRATTAELNVFQVLEMRSVIGFIMLLPLVYFTGGFAAMRTRRPLQHLGRNVAHYIGQFAWLYALTLIPLAQLISIEFTTPIWTALLAVTFLGEKLTRPRVTAIALGLVGIIIIVRPGLDTIETGHLVVLLAALAFGISMVMVKSLTRTDNVVRIIFWMLIIQSVDRARPCPLCLAHSVRRAMAVDTAHRLHRHVLAYLPGAGAGACRRDADRADRFPARAAVGHHRLAALQGADRRLHRSRRRTDPRRKSAQPAGRTEARDGAGGAVKERRIAARVGQH